ncbi:MAG: SDR family NAD(P)-dependent oxidoreductase [Rubrimonas sp.]|uniref:SDR family NAD(P)-dependent oxidoreductase n=1 Tax=Rubrimonas sp. TaxID=2036015 RepID=UPI002FDC9CDF
MSRTLLITGANRGVGFALARAAAARGDVVLATARDPVGSDAPARLAAEGGDVDFFALDVTEPDRAEDLARLLADRTLDILVCNAGAYLGRGGIDDPALDAEAWRTVLMTNVAGPFFTVRAFLPLLRKAPAGKVAVISSIMGSTTRAKGGSYAYRASKAAATNLACNLAAELKPMGVAVGAYHPGWVRTEMGGAGADVEPRASAAGLLARFDALSLATTGVVEDYAGAPIPL